MSLFYFQWKAHKKRTAREEEVKKAVTRTLPRNVQHFAKKEKRKRRGNVSTCNPTCSWDWSNTFRSLPKLLANHLISGSLVRADTLTVCANCDNNRYKLGVTGVNRVRLKIGGSCSAKLALFEARLCPKKSKCKHSRKWGQMLRCFEPKTHPPYTWLMAFKHRTNKASSSSLFPFLLLSLLRQRTTNWLITSGLHHLFSRAARCTAFMNLFSGRVTCTYTHIMRALL